MATNNNKKKDLLRLKVWKKIKSNGNARKKRRELINALVSPSVVFPRNKCNVINENEEKMRFEHTNPTNYLVPDEHFQYFDNEEQQNDIATDQNSQNDDWDVELDEITFQHLDTEIKIEDKRLTLIDNIREWSAKYLIKQNALNALLTIINQNFPELSLPKDSRTIMATPRHKCDINVDEFGGSYWHYGLENALRNCLNKLEIDKDIQINVNVDGLPLFKSSRFEFWPILVNIHTKPDTVPMVVGIYYGQGKPKDVNWFMKPFVEEYLSIENQGGLNINGKIISIKIRCFICDTPARHYLKGVIGSNGYNGCLKCETKGKYSYTARTMIYTDINCALRTDTKFRFVML